MPGQSLHNFDYASSIGGLAVLPYEVRQQILHFVLQEWFCTDSSAAQWRFESFFNATGPFGHFVPEYPDLAVIPSTPEGFIPSIFELRSYHISNRKCHDNFFEIYDPDIDANIRLVSRVLRAEWEDMLLTTHTFSFSCAKQLQFFSCQLAPHQRDRLFHVSFTLFSCQECCWRGRFPSDEWMEELKILPREVQTVDYELGVLTGPSHRKGMESQIEALVGSKSKLEACIVGLDVLNQRVMRGINPEVRTRMKGLFYAQELSDKQRARFDRVLQESDK